MKLFLILSLQLWAQGDAAKSTGMDLFESLRLEDLRQSPVDQSWAQQQKRKIRSGVLPELYLEERLEIRPDILTSKQKRQLKGEDAENSSTD